jgi:hypothetical protein
MNQSTPSYHVSVRSVVLWHLFLDLCAFLFHAICATSPSPVNLHNCYMLYSHYVGHCITAFAFYFGGLLVVVFPICAVHCQFSRIQGSHFTVLISGNTFIYFQNVCPWKADATCKLLLWILCPFMKSSRVHVSGYGKWQSHGAWAAWYLGEIIRPPLWGT